MNQITKQKQSKNLLTMLIYPLNLIVLKIVEISINIVMQNAHNVAVAFSLEKLNDDFYDKLEQMDLDAVSVRTPNNYHASATIAALEAGCHVLCEKPPSMNAEEAKLMAYAAKKAGKL